MKRRIALLLAIVMVMGLLPVHVSAAEDSVETPLLQETEIQDVLPQEEEAQTDLLPEAETIVPEAEVVLPEAPVSLVGLEWTEDMGMVWTLPEENAGFDLYEIEIMYAEQAVDNPAESWQTTDAFTVAAGAFADEAAWDEVGSYSRFVIGTHGGGWYYFRVKAASAARSDAETGIWAYSDGLAVEATAELRLHDNNDYSTSPVTMTGTIGATVDLSGYSRDTQARYFAFASAANLAAWNTKADGSGDDYMTAEILTLNGDLDLYGRWVGMKIGIGNDYYPADESASGDGWFYGGDDTLYLDGYTGGMIYAPRGMTIIVDGENTVTGDIICEEDLHITVQASASLTLAGCVLSGDFELIANGNMTITTDAFTAVDVQNDVYMTGSGMIEIEAQETAIVCDGLTIPSTMMIFCHPQQITPSFEYEGEAYIRLEKKASLILSDPDWAGEEGHTPTWSLDGETDPGLIGGYEVRYYFSEDENTIPDPEDWIGWYDYEDGEPVALPDQLLAKYGSGYYRFDVRPYPIHPGMAAGQWTEISPAAYFETAAERLSVSDVAWVDGRTFSWTNDFENTALVDYYEVAIYYGEDENSVDTDQYVSVQYYTHDDLPVSLWNSTLKNNGAGYYAFRVRPISVDPMQALSGDWSELSELYYFAGPTDVAPQAYDLQWSEQGEVSFIPVLPEGEEWVRFEIEIFRREAGGEVGILGLNVGYNSEWTDEERVTENVFADTSEMYQSGTYYFTVTTIGDGIVMADSAPVCSADWTYVCPDRQLEVIDPVWNEDMSISWTDNVAAGIEHYEVQFQVVTEGAVLDPEDWDDWEYYYPDEETYMLSENVYQNLGSGTYYFRVMAYPAGIYEARPSEWSEWSAGFEYTMPELTLNATDLAWNEETMEMTWSLGEADPAWVDHYSIRFYYSEESAPTANEYDKRYSRIVRTEDLSYMLPAYDLADYGAGYYAFSIRAYSKDLSKAFSGSYSELSPALYFAGPSEKAPQASDLAWNVYRKNETSSMEEMGTISFKNPCYDAEERPYTEFWVDIYRKEASGDLLIGSFTTNTSNAYRNSYPFDMLPEMYESGIYYFTVTTLGDGVTMGDSDPVRSADWTYTCPDVQLAVSDPVWGDGMTMQWTAGSVMPDWYDIRVQYVGEDEEFYPDDWHFTMSEDGEAVSFTIPQSRLNKYGAGRYYFQIRAVSGDPTKAVTSPWSEWSAPQHYMTAKVTELGADTLTLDVCGGAEAELFIAVYDKSGRMIGAGHNAMHPMSVDGRSYTAAFDGDPDTIKVFALDASGTPYGSAVTLKASLIEGYVLVTDSEFYAGTLASTASALIEVLHLDGTGYAVYSLDTRRISTGDARVTQYKAPDGTWVTITDSESIPYGFYGYTLTEDGEIVLYDLGTDERGEAQVLSDTVKASGKQDFTFGDRTDLVTDNDTVLHLVTSSDVETYEGYKNIKIDEPNADALITYKGRTVEEIYIVY